MPLALPHGLTRMTGRSPSEKHRAATPLELLYDLTIVVAISLCGSQFAHALAAGHVGVALIGFPFGMFGIVWAWINYSWFCSAFDTDDWAMRLATLVQMVGVVILALGEAPLFHGLEEGHLDNRVLVAGYVVMRLALVFLWVRVAKDSPTHRPKALAYIRSIVLAQVVWTVLAIVHLPVPATIAGVVVAFAMEVLGVWYAETRVGSSRTPWHPHHIAERYSLLAIISVGEIILGTTTAIDAIVTKQQWSFDAVVVAIAGVALAMGIWWNYFALPWGEVIAARENKVFGFGYGHFVLYLGIAAVGAGLHVAAYYVEGDSALAELGTVLTVAIPVGAVMAGIFAFAHYLLPGRDRFHWLLLVLTVAALALACVLAAAGTSLGVCLFVIMLAPWISVVGYETLGHGHLQRRMREHGILAGHDEAAG